MGYGVYAVGALDKPDDGWLDSVKPAEKANIRAA